MYNNFQKKRESGWLENAGDGEGTVTLLKMCIMAVLVGFDIKKYYVTLVHSQQTGVNNEIGLLDYNR